MRGDKNQLPPGYYITGLYLLEAINEKVEACNQLATEPVPVGGLVAPDGRVLSDASPTALPYPDERFISKDRFLDYGKQLKFGGAWPGISWNYLTIKALYANAQTSRDAVGLKQYGEPFMPLIAKPVPEDADLEQWQPGLYPKVNSMGLYGMYAYGAHVASASRGSGLSLARGSVEFRRTAGMKPSPRLIKFISDVAILELGNQRPAA